MLRLFAAAEPLRLAGDCYMLRDKKRMRPDGPVQRQELFFPGRPVEEEQVVCLLWLSIFRSFPEILHIVQADSLRQCILMVPVLIP